MSDDDEKMDKLAKWLDFQFGGPQVGNQVRAIGERLRQAHARLDAVLALCDETEQRLRARNLYEGMQVLGAPEVRAAAAGSRVDPQPHEPVQVTPSPALVELVQSAMAAGAMSFVEMARSGQINPEAALGDAFTDYAPEFCRIRSSLVRAVRDQGVVAP